MELYRLRPTIPQRRRKKVSATFYWTIRHDSNNRIVLADTAGHKTAEEAREAGDKYRLANNMPLGYGYYTEVKKEVA